MLGHTERKFKEEGGYVEGHFKVSGDRVKFLDLPSEPVSHTLQTFLNGKAVRLRMIKKVLSQNDEKDFQDGDLIHFTYQRDPISYYTDEEDAEGFGVSKESYAEADDYTYVFKKDEDGDYAVFVMEFPSFSTFGSCKGEAATQSRKLIAFILDSLKNTGGEIPTPLGFYDIPNTTEHLK